MKYIIEGGNKLEGTVEVSGSKNASLPILAASILNGKTTKLYNIPNISDTQTTRKILELLGCKVTKKGNKIIIDSSTVTEKEIPEELMKKMRSSVVFAGALIGRFKEATFSYPGGCDIGSRPIDLHLAGLKKLGVNIETEAGYIICKCDELIGTDIHLDFPSVGATENIIMAAVLATGETVIHNAAMEPEVQDLANFLNKMGAKIEGSGTNRIVINGVKDLKGIGYNIMPDRIEAGTLLCAGAITGGKIKLKNVVPEHITPILHKLQEAGCEIKTEKNSIYLEAPKKLKAIDVKTMPYPGFPTDMQSVLGATLVTAKGTSLIVENIFENRFKYVNGLNKMGAKISLVGTNGIAIKGVKKLSGSEVDSTDLRGGAAMIIAGLASKGKTKVDNIAHILRGYVDIDKKLNSLGAKITKE